jgi:hypothetical protein
MINVTPQFQVRNGTGRDARENLRAATLAYPFNYRPRTNHVRAAFNE